MYRSALACAVLATILLLSLASSAISAVIYVKWDSPSQTLDGTSWDTAFHTVQEGLNAAASGDEVWVAKGTYLECITLKTGVALYGGFAGTEASRDQRNWSTNGTILDGNKAGSVVTSPTGATDATRIDGFTIRNGDAEYGGGVYCYRSSPMIANNTITGNYGFIGGGVCCTMCSPIIIDNVITGNSAGTGGGLNCRQASSPTVSRNTIAGNTAFGSGGGMTLCLSGGPTVTMNTISGNTATSGNGGGIDCSGVWAKICGNIISANTAPYGGGGIHCGTSASPKITNNTIVGNSSVRGAGVNCEFGTAVVANNIVAFNSSGISKMANDTLTIRVNCVYGNAEYNYSLSLTPGSGDISANPLFVDRVNGNYHLTATSPCINRGSNGESDIPSSDMDGENRVMYDVVDMGADEYPGPPMPTVDTPVFSVGTGTYDTTLNVSISCVTPGTTIYYTTNGMDPTESDSVYTSPVFVGSNLTLKAMGCKAGLTPSTVRSTVYTITPVARPAFSPDGGIYASALHVTMTSVTPGVVIHYTTNGIDPTEDDPVYAGPVLVDANLTLKAKAYRAGGTSSPVKSAVYRIVSTESVAEVKMLPDGAQATLTGCVVSAAFPGYFYVETVDRSAGIRVNKSGHTFVPGMRVDLSGTITTNSTYGERCVSAASAVQSAPPANTGSVDPLILPNCFVGGADWNYDPSAGAGQMGVKGSIHLNNIGTLVATTGRVTYCPSSSYFTICDGSKITDPSGYRGIRIVTPTGLTKPIVGKYVKVTGISTIFKSGTDYYPVIRVRTQADILVFD